MAEAITNLQSKITSLTEHVSTKLEAKIADLQKMFEDASSQIKFSNFEAKLLNEINA